MDGPKRRRNSTRTSAFGVSRREGHDASPFYNRFTLPAISDDSSIQQNDLSVLNEVYAGDSRKMTKLEDNSVALVVTSPPYYAGKQYELAVGEGDVPGSYLDYLELLFEVFKECKRVLEPGGRIAINVANLGRKPYRSLSADVIDILQNRLGLLLRGEVIWVKAEASSGSCAWGSFRSPANPVLRDVTERIIVASKGRFDRAISQQERLKLGLPSKVTVHKDDFVEFTRDTWEVPPESARRVNHPAPFPVEIPHRLIQLYTYKDDVVVDPFMGSGSTAIAALRTDRHFVGYDLDDEYVRKAKERIEREVLRLQAVHQRVEERRLVARPRRAGDIDPEDFQKRATEEGKRAREIASELLVKCGFDVTAERRRLPGGVEVNFTAVDSKGQQWFFDVSGAFTSNRPGLQRTDTVWKSLGRAAVIKANNSTVPLLLLTTDLPDKGSAGHLGLKSTRGVLFHDAIDMFAVEGQRRLRIYASGRNRKKPVADLMLPEER